MRPEIIGLQAGLLTGVVKRSDQPVEMQRAGAMTRYAGPKHRPPLKLRGGYPSSAVGNNASGDSCKIRIASGVDEAQHS